jgi:hypothetical protein
MLIIILNIYSKENEIFMLEITFYNRTLTVKYSTKTKIITNLIIFLISA